MKYLYRHRSTGLRVTSPEPIDRDVWIYVGEEHETEEPAPKDSARIRHVGGGYYDVEVEPGVTVRVEGRDKAEHVLRTEGR